LPEGASDALAAALPNPGLSSWLPLVATAQLKPGETVLVHGATGVAGQLAIQIAKHLGAGRIVAAGRNADQLAKLPQLGADVVIDLKAQEPELLESYTLAAGSAGIDVVLDYLWGAPTEVLLRSLVRKGFPTARAGTRFIQIGESAGPVISLPATTLRGAAITITGSGTMPSRQLLSEAFEQLMDLASRSRLQIEIEEVPLSQIQEAWARHDIHGRRLVLVP
jgi:NADPH2:quinone reductase